MSEQMTYRPASEGGSAEGRAARSSAAGRRAVASFGSTTAEENRAHKASKAFTLVLFLIIVVMLLFTLVLGTNLYRSLADDRVEAGNLRLESSLLLNSIRMNDETDAVARGKGPEGDALVLMEYLPAGNYETRFYAWQGYILQEYAVAGSPYSPDRASKIAASNTFGFDYADGLLTIQTDTGDTSVALRSVRGGDSANG